MAIFGHALRLHFATLAATAMRFYFTTVKGPNKFEGCLRPTIFTTLNDDINTLVDNNSTIITQYKTITLIPALE